jgi:ketosteroid isomerase-like protein
LRIILEQHGKLAGLTREEYMAMARVIYGHCAKGEFEPVLVLFHDDAIYQMIGSRALIPSAGRREGKAEILEAKQAFLVDFETLHVDIEDVVFDYPRCAYISWRMHLRNRGTGAEAEIEGVDRLHWKDDRITEWTRYCDTALLAALGESDRKGDL